MFDKKKTDKDAGKKKNPKIDSKPKEPPKPPSVEPPPSGIYLVKLPKEQIFHVPSPENVQPSTPEPKKKGCFCCFLYSLLVLVVLVAVLIGIFFLVYRPEKPHFSVIGFSVAGFNLTSPSSPISPVFETKVRLKNGNSKLGLIYGKGIAAEVYYDGIKLGNGEFTAFEQPEGNVTVIATALTGFGIQLTKSLRKELTELEKKGKVPFELKIKAPVKFDVGAVKMWTMIVTVDCKVIVDKLTAAATVITENCDSRLGLSVSMKF